jgi:formamidopyrimidine-DNA glycosylase
MPELPEVESLRRYLAREGIVGRVIERVDAESKPSPKKGTGAITGIDKIRGRTVKSLERRGKQMAVVLDEGVMGLHMGMTGRIDVLAPDEPVPRFTRVEFHLVNGDDELRMVLADPRRWGMVQHFDSLETIFGGLGPDALDPDLTEDQFAEAVHRRTSPIKPLLLNQSLIAGVGNIYADEALHRVEISPSRRANRISQKNLFLLFGAIRESLEHALEFIQNHPDERGRPYIVDAQDDRMRLVRKRGSFCPRCEIPLRTLKFGGRTAYFCGRCQR